MQKNYNSLFTKDTTILFNLINHECFNEDHLNLLLKEIKYYDQHLIVPILEIVRPKNLIPYEAFFTRSFQTEHTKQIMDAITKLYGQDYYTCMMNWGCRAQDMVKIECALDNKIIPTKENVKHAVRMASHHTPQKKRKEILELFINYGYTFTYDDFIFSVEEGVFIDNVQRFKFVFDERFLDICHERHYYPAYNYEELGLLDQIDNKIALLCKESGSDNYTRIQKLIKIGGKITKSCVNNAIDCLNIYTKKMNEKKILFVLKKYPDCSLDDIMIYLQIKKKLYKEYDYSEINILMNEIFEMIKTDMDELKSICYRQKMLVVAQNLRQKIYDDEPVLKKLLSCWDELKLVQA